MSNNVKNSPESLSNEFYRGSLAPKPRIEKVHRVVTLLLKNPEFNIKRLPDSIERTVYNSVVYIIMDTIMNIVWNFNHTELYGHLIEMEIEFGELPDKLPDGMTGLDKVAIRNLVENLLKQKLLNLSWLPDTIESNLYFSIILIVFTLIQMSASSTVINLVGHSLHFKFGPNGNGYKNIENKMRSILESEESQRNIDSLVNTMLSNPELNYSFIPDMLEKQIYKSIYNLILCLMDEVFDDLKIDMLGSIVHISLVPNPWRDVVEQPSPTSTSTSTTITSSSNLDNNSNNKNKNTTTTMENNKILSNETSAAQTDTDTITNPNNNNNSNNNNKTEIMTSKTITITTICFSITSFLFILILGIFLSLGIQYIIFNHHHQCNYYLHNLGINIDFDSPFIRRLIVFILPNDDLLSKLGYVKLF